MTIAIIRLSALGDIVYSASILAILKARHPGASITWVVDERFAGILKNVPHIDRLVALPLHRAFKQRSLGLLRQLIQTLSTLPSFDLIIDVQGLIKSQIVSRLLTGHRIGYDSRSAKEGLLSCVYHEHATIPYQNHILERTATLLSVALQQSCHADDLKPSGFLFPEAGSQARNGSILLVIGASNAEKSLTPEQWIELGQQLNQPLSLLYHSQEEETNARTIAASLPQATLLPRHDLSELASVIASMQLVIGGDTGPTHIAWGVGTPSITLFLTTDPKRFCIGTPEHPCLQIDSWDDGSIAQITETAQKFLA